MDASNGRDLVLPPNAFAYVSDETKGTIEVYVGPTKTSLPNEVKPVIFDSVSKTFRRVSSIDHAIQLCPTAPEGWYITLKNPAADDRQPKAAQRSESAELEVGRKVHKVGPTTFALWPGQMVQVVKGHHLRSNQYLLVRVYDKEVAEKNINKSVIATVGNEKKDNPKGINLTMGALSIIKGTGVAFYIPPTGVEIVRTDSDVYVRDAVTLERLEYCILLDESGHKRYVKGPAVVFPEPNEMFIMDKNGHRVYTALEMNENMGIHIKVIADYEEGGTNYVTGQELFITGNEKKIYYPRPEHSIIKYGNQLIHYARAIPKGDGVYVMDKLTGVISVVEGPKMLLANPCKQVMVKRILDKKTVELWFPGNKEALDYNTSLHNESVTTMSFDESPSAMSYAKKGLTLRSAGSSYTRVKAADFSAGDEMSRKTNYTEQPSVTLDAKFDGAVNIAVWPGFAIQVVNKTGERKVVEGPKSILLGYDQTLEHLEMSTGTPKRDDNTQSTVYLKTKQNHITDKISVTTEDLYDVSVTISYRVNFEGDNSKWFGVDNYIKLLTDQCRSLVRNVARNYTINNFHKGYINIIRDLLLGEQKDGARPGKMFEENGMRIYEVVDRGIDIADDEIAGQLETTQHLVMENVLKITQAKQMLDTESQVQAIQRKILVEQAKTEDRKLDIEKDKELKRREIQTVKEVSLNQKEVADQARNTLALEGHKARKGHDLEVEKESTAIQTKAYQDKFTAIQPELIKALIASGDTQLATALANNLPQSIGETERLLGIGGIASLVEAFQGTPMAGRLEKLMSQKDEE